MSKPKNYEKELFKILKELKTDHPELGYGQIFSLAFSEYGDTFHMTDKEMCYALEKYKKELELNIENIAPEKFVDKIIDDANNHLFEGIDDFEDDEEEY